MDILCSDKTGTLTQNRLTLGKPTTFDDTQSQDLILVRKYGGTITEEPVQAGCTFVPLLGRFAWKEEQPGAKE